MGNSAAARLLLGLASLSATRASRASARWPTVPWWRLPGPLPWPLLWKLCPPAVPPCMLPSRLRPPWLLPYALLRRLRAEWKWCRLGSLYSPCLESGQPCEAGSTQRSSERSGERVRIARSTGAALMMLPVPGHASRVAAPGTHVAACRPSREKQHTVWSSCSTRQSRSVWRCGGWMLLRRARKKETPKLLLLAGASTST